MECRLIPDTNNSKQSRCKLIGLLLGLIALLLIGNIYQLIRNKNIKKQIVVIESQLENSISQKDIIKDDYHAALARLDHLVGTNADLKKQLNIQDEELENVKNRIKTILAKSNATETELKEARSLIQALNQKITGYEYQFGQLETENIQLKKEKEALVAQTEDLKKKVEVGKILNASNIRLNPIVLRKGGNTESVTDRAKKVDLLRVLFDINENKLTESGTKEFLIRIIDPEGILLSNVALGSANFIDANGVTQYYSLNKTVHLISGIPLNDIEADWRQTYSYEKGPYLVEIYYDGHMIGQGTTILR